jgi:hypothetical protein
MSVQQAGTGIGALRELEEFPLVEALLGRRSRRFARGGEGSSRPTARSTIRTWPPRWRPSPGASSAPAARSPGDAWGLDRQPRVRGSAQIHDPAFRACVAAQAQYVFDTFGKFPGTVPSVFITTYV